jgi:hypothetical protein
MEPMGRHLSAAVRSQGLEWLDVRAPDIRRSKGMDFQSRRRQMWAIFAIAMMVASATMIFGAQAGVWGGAPSRTAGDFVERDDGCLPYSSTDSEGAPEVLLTQTVNCTINPYAGVNWATYNQHKANFHTHTTNSDGTDSPTTTIGQYSSTGYDILAITDHDYTTWPWPTHPGMLEVRGNEYSGTSPYEHHMNAFYNFTYSAASMEDGIPHVDGNAGLSQINHPGRYRTPSDWALYTSWFEKYPSCVGLEVYNQGDRYPTDRHLWDNINQNLMPKKLVWGYSNDDKHTTSHLYHNYQFMLMPSLTEGNLRECQRDGAFYFCYEPSGTGTGNVPRISNIVVNDVAKTITITATGYSQIQWVSEGTAVVATGSTFSYGSFANKTFVRAVLDGPNGDSFTQPFGLRTTDNAAPASPSNQEVDWWGRSGTSPNTYTYSGVTQAMSTPNAWFCDSDYATSGELTTPNSQTEFTDVQYVSASSSDDSRAASANPGTGDEIFTKCSFTISEAMADISSIDFTMEIQSDTASYFSIFAYNFTSAVWKQIGPTTANIAADTDTTITRSITVKPSDYVSGTKEVRWGCYQMTSAQLVRLDFVRMTINRHTFSTSQDNCVNWTKSADDGAGANDVVGYKIYRSDAQSGPWDIAHHIATVPAGNMQYFDVGKGQGDSTRWWYVVRAFDVPGAEEMNTIAVQEPSAAGAWASIPVVDGWNLVSIPIVGTTSMPGALTDLNGTIVQWTRAMWFDPRTPADPWKQYNTAWAPSLNDLTAVNNTMGVWLYVTTVADGAITVGGSGYAKPTSTAIPLKAGWNLVGFPSDDTAFTVASLKGACPTVTIVEQYDGAQTYKTSVMADGAALAKGRAYWVYTTADTTWNKEY